MKYFHQILKYFPQFFQYLPFIILNENLILKYFLKILKYVVQILKYFLQIPKYFPKLFNISPKSFSISPHHILPFIIPWTNKQTKYYFKSADLAQQWNEFQPKALRSYKEAKICLLFGCKMYLEKSQNIWKHTLEKSQTKTLNIPNLSPSLTGGIDQAGVFSHIQAWSDFWVGTGRTPPHEKERHAEAEDFKHTKSF